MTTRTNENLEHYLQVNNDSIPKDNINNISNPIKKDI